MFIPEGYILFGAAIQEIADANSRMFTPTSLNTTEDASDYESECYREALNAFGVALASETMQAVGIVDSTGEIVAIPSGYWRTKAARQFLEALYQHQHIEGVEGYEFSDIVPIIPKLLLNKLFPEIGYDETATVWPKGWIETRLGLDFQNAVSDDENKSRSTVDYNKFNDVRSVGRRRKYDWDAFYIEAIKFVALNGLEYENADEFRKNMQRWVADAWGGELDISQLNKRIKGIIDVALPEKR